MKPLRGIFRSGNFTINRVETFSDGIFAIVATLLILEIRVPYVEGTDVARELLNGLRLLTPKFFCYVLSFMYIAIYWVNHHQLFHIIKRSDRGLFWFNSFFLMLMAFIPFPTALIGEYPGQAVAVMFYGIAMFITALSFVAMKWYALDYAKLTDPNLPKNHFKDSRFKIIAGPLLYFLAIFLSAVDTRWAIAIYAVIPVIYFIPGPSEK